MQEETKETRTEAPLPAAASKEFTWSDGTVALPYTACAEMVAVDDRKGERLGSMFCVSYTVAPDDPARPRPVSFCFNGGPGSSSVPINLGGIGPVHVKTHGTDHLACPGVTEDNPASPLPCTDLVFMDALGTGWSVVEKGKGPEVWGVEGDANAFAGAIASWLTAHGRWGSPVYLFGESYGTVRNAVLARVLGERGIGVAGVVLLSAILDWAQTLPGNDLYYLGMVPTYAACAQWFGRAGAGVEENAWFAEASRFCDRELAAALVLGDRLEAAEEARLAERLEHFTGVDAAYWRRHHLRVELEDFRRELLRDEGKTTGRLDMRFWTWENLPVQGDSEFFACEDPADDAVEAAWVAAFRAQMAAIGFAGPAQYLSDNYEVVNKDWKWAHGAPGALEPAVAPNVAFDLAVALRRNPTMRLCVIGGRYDAATTYWNVLHDLSRLYLPDELKERVECHLYGCGHMAYVDEETNAAMGAMLRAFYAKRG